MSRLHKIEDVQCISVWLLFSQLQDKKFSTEKVLQKYDGNSPSLPHPWVFSGFH